MHFERHFAFQNAQNYTHIFFPENMKKILVSPVNLGRVASGDPKLRYFFYLAQVFMLCCCLQTFFFKIKWLLWLIMDQ